MSNSPKRRRKPKEVITLTCSFCGKNQNDVRIVAGPTVYICEECVKLCNGILDIEREEKAVVNADKELVSSVRLKIERSSNAVKSISDHLEGLAKYLEGIEKERSDEKDGEGRGEAEATRDESQVHSE